MMTLLTPMIVRTIPLVRAALVLPMLVGTLLLTQPAAAQFGETRDSAPIVEVQVLPEAPQVEVGKTFHLAIVFDIKPGWHIYWKNPGAGAMPPYIEVSAPKSCSVGEIRWPRPKTIKNEVGDMYGYEGRTILFVPIKVQAATSAVGAVMFGLDVGWAMCDDSTCRIADKQLSTQVRVTGGGGIGSRRPPTTAPPLPPGTLPGDKEQRAKLLNQIKQQLERMPIQITDDEQSNTKHKTTIAYDDGVLTITGPAHGHSSTEFFSGGVNGISFADVTCEIKDDAFAFRARVEINRGNIVDNKPMIRGLIALGKKSGDPSYEFTLPLPGREHRHERQTQRLTDAPTVLWMPALSRHDKRNAMMTSARTIA